MGRSLPLHQLQSDELVAGYLGRLGLRLGLEWKPSDLRYRLYRRIRELGHDVNYDIFTIVELFSGINRQELVEFHSLAPFSHAFTRNDGGKSFADIKSKGEYCAREILGLFNKPNACPDCVQADLQEHGFTYWHRIHQIPGAFYCPRHGIRLVSIRERFPYYRQPHHFLVSSKPNDGHNTTSKVFHDRMTQIWLGILSARKTTYIWRAVELVERVYSENRIRIWDVALNRIATSSAQYSHELSQFKKELGAARQDPYEARLLVAALAASSVEVQHLVDSLTSPAATLSDC